MPTDLLLVGRAGGRQAPAFAGRARQVLFHFQRAPDLPDAAQHKEQERKHDREFHRGRAPLAGTVTEA
jgi:hypothetical protein